MSEPVAVSPTQESSLLMAPHNPSREFMSWVYQLNGRLDVGALAQAIDDVVEAHEVLRTVFVPGGSGSSGGSRSSGGAAPRGHAPGLEDVATAEQVVTPFRPGVLWIVDLEDRPKVLALADAVRAVEADYRDLSPWAEPRLTATLYRVAPKTHVLSIFVAEALVDGESGTLVAAELSRAYAKHAGRVPPDELAVPGLASYVDFVRDHPVPDAVQQRAVSHWESFRELPVAAGDWPMAPGPRATTRFFNVPADEWGLLVATTPGMAAVPFVVVLSWLELALSEVVGAERFVGTSAVSNRSRPETKDMIGNFVGPVRLPAEVHAGERLEDVSPRVMVALRQAIAASAVPVPLAEARLQAPAPFVPPAPTVAFFMFGEREGPNLAGVRQRRFRVNTGLDVLRVNCTPDDRGGRNFFFISTSAPPDLLDRLVHAFRRHLAPTG